MAASPDDRAVERLLFRAIGAFVAVLLAGAFFALQRDADDAQPTGPSSGAEPLNAIGPLDGAQVATYTRTRQAALSSAEGLRGAVVSFGRYVTAEVARRAVAPLEPEAYFVAAPGGHPSAVETLDKWATEEREAATKEKAELERLLASGTVDQPDFEAQYRAEVTRLDRVLALIDPAGEMVFAVAVEAPAQDLRDVGLNPTVRLVDVGASSSLPALASLRGLRPEELVTAGDPPQRPAG